MHRQGIGAIAIAGLVTASAAASLVFARPLTSDSAARPDARNAPAAGSTLQDAPSQAKNEHIAAVERQIAGREQQPAEQVFRNIQVLKGMPAIRVLRVMEMAFVPNLGVDCAHCHVEGDWESDAKRAKRIARDMWTLRARVQGEVRTITGRDDAVVTCYTCHKGKPKAAYAPER